MNLNQRLWNFTGTLAITYSEVSSLSDNRSDLMMGVKKLMQRLNEEQLSHERCTSASSSFTSDSPSDYKVNKLKIKLPRFDGNTPPLEQFLGEFRGDYQG